MYANTSISEQIGEAVIAKDASIKMHFLDLSIIYWAAAIAIEWAMEKMQKSKATNEEYDSFSLTNRSKKPIKNTSSE